jgi:hypothetical protein
MNCSSVPEKASEENKKPILASRGSVQYMSILWRIGLSSIICLLMAGVTMTTTSIDTKVANRSVVFFYRSDPTGNVVPTAQYGTGFLIAVPTKDRTKSYIFLVTARHIVDPVWAGCTGPNPAKLFIRANKKDFNLLTDSTGIGFIAVDLISNGISTWSRNQNENVDVAVLKVPTELVSGKYDVQFINFANFGTPEEIAKMGPGSQIASTGLVPGIEGEKRNYPIFKFGKVASIPDELVSMRCTPSSSVRPLAAWWLGIALVPGNSGSPIYFDPLFPPSADITDGEPRAMIIGLQSLSVSGADLAGMTPAKYIMEVISSQVPADADLTIGVPPQKKN